MEPVALPVISWAYDLRASCCQDGSCFHQIPNRAPQQTSRSSEDKRCFQEIVNRALRHTSTGNLCHGTKQRAFVESIGRSPASRAVAFHVRRERRAGEASILQAAPLFSPPQLSLTACCHPASALEGTGLVKLEVSPTNFASPPSSSALRNSPLSALPPQRALLGLLALLLVIVAANLRRAASAEDRETKVFPHVFEDAEAKSPATRQPTPSTAAVPPQPEREETCWVVIRRSKPWKRFSALQLVKHWTSIDRKYVVPGLTVYRQKCYAGREDSLKLRLCHLAAEETCSRKRPGAQIHVTFEARERERMQMSNLLDADLGSSEESAAVQPFLSGRSSVTVFYWCQLPTRWDLNSASCLGGHGTVFYPVLAKQYQRNNVFVTGSPLVIASRQESSEILEGLSVDPGAGKIQISPSPEIDVGYEVNATDGEQVAEQGRRRKASGAVGENAADGTGGEGGRKMEERERGRERREVWLVDGVSRVVEVDDALEAPTIVDAGIGRFSLFYASTGKVKPLTARTFHFRSPKNKSPELRVTREGSEPDGASTSLYVLNPASVVTFTRRRAPELYPFIPSPYPLTFERTPLFLRVVVIRLRKRGLSKKHSKSRRPANLVSRSVLVTLTCRSGADFYDITRCKRTALEEITSADCIFVTSNSSSLLELYIYGVYKTHVSTLDEADAREFYSPRSRRRRSASEQTINIFGRSKFIMEGRWKGRSGM